MLSDLPVARSERARILFVATAALTAAILLWSHSLALQPVPAGVAPIFFMLFAHFDSPAATGALLILLAALFVPSRISFRPLLTWLGDHPGQVAAATLITFCAGALLVYHDHPLSMDEYAVLFQAQAFASGHLTGQFPLPLMDWLIPSYFQNYFLDVSPTTGAVASSYWPAFALLLTPFALFGIPWACNPLISALTVLVVHRLALRIFKDREAAGLAVLLTVASPVFFANGISYYSMPAHLLANGLYALLLLHPTSRSALLAGVVGSIALTLHNPVPHILFAIPWAIWLVTRENGLRLLPWLIAGYLPLSLLLGVGWFWFCGHLMHEGVTAAAGAQTTEGLQRVTGAFDWPTSTVLFTRLIALAKVWVWAVPGLLILAGVGAWRWRRDPGCQLLLASAVLTLTGYLFVPADQGHGWGFRYFHSAWLALPLLATAALIPGLAHPSTRSAATRPQDSQVPSDDGVRTFFVACALATLVAGVGMRAVQMNEFISDMLSQLPTYTGAERRVVFIDVSRSFYGADLVQNDPWLRGNVVRMLSHGEAPDAALMREHFPDLHRVYQDGNGTVWSAAPAKVAGGPPSKP